VTATAGDPTGDGAAAPRAVLAGMALFSQLTEAQLDLVGAATRRRRLARGDVLFRAGDPGTAFFGVIGGQVKLALSAAAGGERVLEIISAGETFGEAVVFAGRPYPVTATALLATSLAVVPAPVVLDLVAADPMFARRMLAGLSVRLHTLISEVEAISLRSGTQRVAGLLLSLAADGPVPGAAAGPAPPPAAPGRAGPGRGVIVLPAGKAVLASRLNLTPETFSRTLRDLAGARLIEVHGRRIVVLDAAGLTAAAGG